jgi:hypothetical protein
MPDIATSVIARAILTILLSFFLYLKFIVLCFLFFSIFCFVRFYCEQIDCKNHKCISWRRKHIDPPLSVQVNKLLRRAILTVLFSQKSVLSIGFFCVNAVHRFLSQRSTIAILPVLFLNFKRKLSIV